MRRRLRLMQTAVAVMALLGFASVTIIGLAIADLYSRQHDTDVKLCIIVQAEWDQIQRLGTHVGLPIPLNPPPCPY